jgi:ABC-type lipoprotein release transport system permease subunit
LNRFWDVLTFTIVLVILFGVSVAAALRPALRAACVDPLVALRRD